MKALRLTSAVALCLVALLAAVMFVTIAISKVADLKVVTVVMLLALGGVATTCFLSARALIRSSYTRDHSSH